MKNRVELALGQHCFNRVLIQAGREYLMSAGKATLMSSSISATHSMTVERHAVFVLEDAAHPQHGAWSSASSRRSCGPFSTRRAW